ncbi:EAP30/Vps36 family-domain-containing protein [Vararia minispora EC-137]|uniref:EAP30/Vps36 family-domain-containing protein n=1 Tax=Vararia minispora EC-137 TaxID=1314806 RepID=A0ACB8QFC4_9AGAM|nr:EAP30/Vps36 family-domain-containing protein [Vararia minispora EC-137]
MSTALQRFTRTVDGTIPVPALLYVDEDQICNQDNVGIYDGIQKSSKHQNGTVYVTSHRLFYIDATKSHSHSFSLDLALVVRTDYYAGLFASSPKVTLYLASSSAAPENDLANESWICELCNFRNPPGTSLSAARCTLCGVPRARSSSSTPTPAYPTLRSGATLRPALTDPAPSRSPAPAEDEVACPACTFLNHPSMKECEICGMTLPRLHAVSAPASRAISPSPEQQSADESGTNMIKLSFRKGGDKPLYAALRRSLLGKAWEVQRTTRSVDDTGAERSGISGLIRSAEATAQTRQDDMQDALADLETLMVKARDMIRLSADLNERLTAISSVVPASDASATSILSSSTHTSAYAPSALIPTTQTDDATFIRSSLVQLGLHMENTPVTLDMIRDEKRWHEELARELAGVLQGSGRGPSMMRTRGIIGIDEVWGGWNRARGVALIPPETFLQALPHLGAYTDPPIQMRKFPSSGLTVLHTPSFAPASFVGRLQGFISEHGPRTTLEVAWAEEIPTALAAEMLAEAEMAGEICRDETPGLSLGLGADGTGEVHWWLNIFQTYQWDGQEDIDTLHTSLPM